MRRTAFLAGLAVLLVAAAFLFLRRDSDGGGDDRASSSVDGGDRGFIGAESCRACHQAEYASWKGSQHDRAMQHAREGTVLGDFDGATFTAGSVTSTFFRRDGKYYVRTNASDGTVRDFEIGYTFGVEPLQQYLIELPGGRIQPLSIAWDSRPAEEGGQRWFHLYPGDGLEHTDELHWSGRAQNWNFMCADCHSTDVRKGYDAEKDEFRTGWAEVSVGCEACHGPGSRHLEWAETPGVLRALLRRGNGLPVKLTEREGVRWAIDAATGRPVRSEPRTTDREVQLCAQCHSRRAQIAEGFVAEGARLHDHYTPQVIVPGLYHADGQQQDEVYVYGSFLQSRMFHAGVTCSDCHDPHSQKLRLPGNQLCGQCHTPASYDTAEHHFHPAGSAGAQCVSCHMPETTYMLVDPRRDHSIRVPRPDQSVSLGVPNACNACHTDRTAEWAASAVREHLGRDAVGFQRFAEAFDADERDAPGAAVALARLAADRDQPAIVRASALARLANRPGPTTLGAASVVLEDADPLVRRSALLALETMPARDRLAVVTPLLRDPARSVRIQAAWALAAVAAGLSSEGDREAFAAASGEFVAAQRLNADRAESRLTLGNFFLQLGRTAEAAAEYRAAMRLAPRLAAPYVNLAELLRGAGQEADAERTIREGLAVAPDHAPLHHALGLSLARSGRTLEAAAELGRAAELSPAEPRFAYAYAVALHDTGRAPRAIEVLEAALGRHPRDRDLLFALATFHRDAGRTADAARYATRLVDAFPDDPDARTLLRSLTTPPAR